MYAAIDIGGTKTLVAVFDAKGDIIEHVKFPSPRDYSQFKSELAAQVSQLSTKTFDAFCVAAPGRVDREAGAVHNFGNLGWGRVPLVADIQDVLKAPGVIENDAKIAGLSEALVVEGTYTKVLYATISTGIGAGLIINGQIDPHLQDIEPGHMHFEHEGKIQKWESFASGKAIFKRVGKLASDIPAEDKDTWGRIARDLSLGFINIVANLAPDVIIIGGGVGTHLPRFKALLDEHLHSYQDPLLIIPPIVQAKRPEEAVIYGCYELAKRLHGKATGSA